MSTTQPPPDGWYWHESPNGGMGIIQVERGELAVPGDEFPYTLAGWPEKRNTPTLEGRILGPVAPYESEMSDEAPMFRWLLAADPRTLAAIAWRVPEACAYSDPVEAIRAAMKATPAPSPTPQAPPALTS